MSQIDTIHKSEFPRCHIHRHYLEHKKGSSNGTCSGTHAYIIEGDFIRTESGISEQKMSYPGVPRNLVISLNFGEIELFLVGNIDINLETSFLTSKHNS